MLLYSSSLFNTTAAYQLWHHAAVTYLQHGCPRAVPITGKLRQIISDSFGRKISSGDSAPPTAESNGEKLEVKAKILNRKELEELRLTQYNLFTIIKVKIFVCE